jgi:hypothetical protein
MRAKENIPALNECAKQKHGNCGQTMSKSKHREGSQIAHKTAALAEHMHQTMDCSGAQGGRCAAKFQLWASDEQEQHREGSQIAHKGRCEGSSSGPSVEATVLPPPAFATPTSLGGETGTHKAPG